MGGTHRPRDSPVEPVGLRHRSPTGGRPGVRLLHRGSSGEVWPDHVRRP